MKLFSLPRVTFSFAFLSLALGITVIYGWHTHNVAFIQVIPTFVPMQYNTALGFIFSGLGLFSLHQHFIKWSRLFGLFLFTLGIATLSQYIWGWDLAIDQLLMEHYIDYKNLSHPGRMAPNTALCFSLFGIALVYLSSLNNKALALGVGGNLGAIVASLGGVALIGYAIGFEDTLGWMSLTKMAVHTSLGFVILGIGLFCFSLNLSQIHESKTWPKWLVSAAGFAGVSLTFAIWQEIKAYERQMIHILNLDNQTLVMANESVLVFGLLITVTLTFLLWNKVIETDKHSEHVVIAQSITPNRIFTVFIILGAVLSFSIYQVLHISFQNTVKLKFNTEVLSHSKSIEQGVNLYVDALYDLRTAVESSEHLTRDGFKMLTARDIGQLSGLVSIQWAPKVTEQEREQFESQQVQGRPINIIEQTEGNQLIRAKDNPVYFPVYYAEPIAENMKALGFNVLSNPGALKSFDVMVEQDLLYATSKLTLIQKKDETIGVVIQLPIFARSDKSSQASQKELVGLGVMVINIAAMVEDVLDKFSEPAGINLVFEDLSAPDGDQFMYHHRTRLHDDLNNNRLTHSTTIPFANRTWKITGHAADSLVYPPWSMFNLILPFFSFAFSIFIALFLRKTALKEQERSILLTELATKEARYSTLVDTIPGTVFIAQLDANYSIDYISSEVTDLTQYQVEDFVNNDAMSFFSLTVEDDIEKVKKALDIAINEDAELAIEYRIKTKNNGERFIYLKGKTLINHKNQSVALHATAIDVTERKRSEKRFENLLETAPDAMIIIDASGKIIIANQQTVQMFGYSKEELIGQTIEILIPDKYKHTHPKLRQQYFDVPSVRAMGQGLELFGLHKDGSQLPIEISLSPMTTKNGEVVSAAIRNVSTRKQMEAELMTAMQKAQAATQAKSDFLANMSHEIRTPMNSIIGMSYLALQTELTDKQRNYVEKTHQAAESLLGIINDILDFSKIEAGQLTVENVEFDLNKTLDSLSNIIGLKAEEKGVELVFDVPKETPRELIGDPLRILQVLINLGTNAIKFTNKGEVVIAVAVKTMDDDSVCLHFSVTDTGIGMSQAQMDKLFVSFSQADSSTTRKFGGTGLGLVISKKLIELMGGEINVRSDLQKGSCFEFELTLGRFQKTISEEEVSELDLPSLNVLVVDDNKASREILSTILEGFNIRTMSCSSGIEAIELVKKYSETDPFHFVFMDWKMPGIDGIEATRQIQADPNIKEIPTFIMVTAFVKEEAIEAAQDIKLKAFLTKPVTASTMLDTLMDVGETRKQIIKGSHVAIPSTPYREQLAGANVLLVEDNEFNQELAIELLSLNDINVEVANNGLEAISMLHNKHYDGVLMDCQMPVMDGYTATEEIRRDKKFTHLPILAMTANAMAGDKEKALASGMNAHISKPINVDVMLGTMAKWITASSPKQEAKEQLNSSQNIEQAQTTLPNFEFMDIKKALGYCAGNETLLLKLLSRYGREQITFIQTLRSCIKDNDFVTATRHAHSLKSASASLGFDELAERSAELEHQLAVLSPDVEIAIALHKDIDMLEQQLMIATNEIKQFEQTLAPQGDISDTSKTLSEDELKDKLTLLNDMISSFDAASIELVAELVNVTNLATHHEALTATQSALEEFDFEQAEIAVKQLIEQLQ